MFFTLSPEWNFSPESLGSRAKVVSASLHPNHGTRYVGVGECVISLVLSHCSKDSKWWTSVTARLQLRALFGKQRKVHPQGMRAVQPQMRGLNPSWLLFLSPPPWACPMQIGLAKKGVCLFNLKFSLRSMDFLLFHFHRLFPFFVFWPQPFWTPFSYSNYLTGLFTQ